VPGFALCALAFLLFFAALAAAQDTRNVVVQRVVDGDTVEVRPEVEGTEDVRLLGVDTPETVDPNEDVEPFGPQASAFTKQRLEGERVTLVFDEERVDSSGRALAFVRLGRAGDATFNEELLRGGYAQLNVVPPNGLYEARLRRAQEEARRQGHLGAPQSPAVRARRPGQRDRGGHRRVRRAGRASARAMAAGATAGRKPEPGQAGAASDRRPAVGRASAPGRLAGRGARGLEPLRQTSPPLTAGGRRP
jgi:endonuclease YncB( thermonuclease family)